jgi:MFS transporter, NHS family, xanthosine permease
MTDLLPFFGSDKQNNSLNGRLTIANFLQFFVWGAWLITIGNYWFITMHWSGAGIGKAFGTLGIASIFMPMITGILADKYINAERLLGICHLLSACFVAYMPSVTTEDQFFWVMLGAMFFYMPTIALCNSVSYTSLVNSGQDVVKVFPPIRVFGTIGFIAAMWVTNLTGNKASANMFYISAISSLFFGVYCFVLPKCKPQNTIHQDASFIEKIGLKAIGLFTQRNMALFFIFSMFLGAALQLTNMYGDAFLSQFGDMPQYKTSFVVKYSTIVMSISQISETLFILAIPFFLRKFGIKKVMLISMLAWVLRFGLFGYGDPSTGLWMILLSNIVYGMAFDFFNISGSLFVETNTDSSIRNSAQGLFMLMTNGLGAYFGSTISGKCIDLYFTENGVKNWHQIWIAFAIYALIVAISFALIFKENKTTEAAKAELN